MVGGGGGGGGPPRAPDRFQLKLTAAVVEVERLGQLFLDNRHQARAPPPSPPPRYAGSALCLPRCADALPFSPPTRGARARR
jgi:hypothetical protein